MHKLLSMIQQISQARLKRDAEDHRINAVPEGDREAHGDEGNQGQEESKE